MSNRPHPQAFEQAFLFGESVVLLFYHAEHRWFYASNFDPRMPELVDVRVAQLRDLIDQLRRIFPSRARPRICDQLVARLDEAWEQYRSAWGSETHRDAINDFNNDNDFNNNNDSEAATNVYPVLLRQAPVMGEAWMILKDAAISFIDALPSMLRKLAQLGELVSTGLWWSEAYSELQQKRRGSRRQCLSVDLNGHLNAKMRELRRGFPQLREVSCDLYGLVSSEVVSRLDQFRSQILVAIQRYAAELEQAHENETPRTTVRRPGLRPSHASAWRSYEYAIRKMDLSGSSSRRNYKAVWNWLHVHGLADDQFPPLKNFSRYVCQAEKFYQQHPDQRPSGGTNRSLVDFSEADMSRCR